MHRLSTLKRQIEPGPVNFSDIKLRRQGFVPNCFATIKFGDEQLKHLVLIAHYCYKSFDLALRCVMLLEQRRALPEGAQQTYLKSLAPR